MQTYPKNFEQKIGFDRIRELLRDKCVSDLGRKQVDRISFCGDYRELVLMLDQTEEFRQIILQGSVFPGSNYYDPEEAFYLLRLAGTFVEAEVLLDLKRSVETILQIISILGRQDNDGKQLYPALSWLIKDIEIDIHLPVRINDIVDEKARVRDSASEKLAGIRKTRSDLEIRAGKRIQQLLAEGKSQGWISQDTELSLRNGRQVIPVPAAYKRRIRGFVHDQSATGQTVFLEPEEVFDFNNQIRELELDERQEVIRILTKFADYLRPMLPALSLGYLMMGQVDAIRAKARLAIDMDALKPVLKNEAVVDWVNARHPLLYLSYKKQKKHVEPFSATLNQDIRILVISGPNAGGKSVCLKAFGLLQYMIQCGMLVPLADYSETGVFEQIFIDIGDEQSLENDLSTYSSHLVNMKFFVSQCNHKTLFLIDEFGTGTEPRIGGAIAEAILQALCKSKALGVVTTHYANLKVMADKHDGLVNGSMLFDTRHMKPLFRLRTGSPGSSFAFEIAQTIGLPADILKNAEALAGAGNLDFDRQLQDLEVKKIELDQKEIQLRSADNFLSGMIDKYQALYDLIEGRKTEIILQARKEAKQILDNSNKVIERTIREIREHQADRSRTRESRDELTTFIKKEEEALRLIEKPEKKKARAAVVSKAEGTPVTGDMVRITGQKSIGEVIEINGNQAVVSYGVIKLKTPLEKLERLDKSSLPEKRRPSVIRTGFDINEKAANFSPGIDLRGLRAEEARTKLRAYIDDAILLNMKQVKILHGKGDGILRVVIREFLQGVGEVHRFRDEHPDRGGAGATIVDFSL